MTGLPQIYGRFRPLFAKMDLPLRRALEGMLHSFATVPIPNTAHERQPTGAFVGFDGIENKGGLSQLLESEWLMRELDPDDFVRRVAESEVLYRRRDFVDTGAKDVLCVVLDCGPWMLGHHRLVALASLFFLALRAERIGAHLRWTVPGVAMGWTDGLTAENIRIFLGRVVQEPLTTADMDKVVDGFETGPKELWYVGGARAQGAAQHPDVTGRITVDTQYETHQQVVKVTGRGRQSTLLIDAVPDADTVAALRRPFMPERKVKPVIAKDRGDLTKEPFLRDWILDRFNHAVVIRYPNGALWYPFGAGRHPVWIAVPKDTLLAIQPEAKEKLGVLLGHGGTKTELVTVQVTGQHAIVEARSSAWFETEIGAQPDRAMGNLHVAFLGKCLLAAADGTAHPVLRKDAPKMTGDLGPILYSDGTYIVDMVGEHLRATNPRRGTLLRVPLPGELADLCETPRRIWFSPTSKTIAITVDGHAHSVLSHDSAFHFELEGRSLLHLQSNRQLQARVWDAGENRLVQVHLRAGRVQEGKSVVIDTPVNGTPRFCPLTQTIFAMNTDDTGAPADFVPLETARGWQNAKAFNIPDAIEKAVTLWL